jgi:putative tricarboxylic transport membrane protein
MRKITRHVAVVTVAALALTGCGAQQDGAVPGAPSETETVVHTGPGGGSDVFARQVIKLMQQDKLISDSWPVRNQTDGASMGAMKYVADKQGSDDTIAAITPTWLVTPLTIAGGTVTIDDLQPIAALLIEPQMMAVRTDSPYHAPQDFINAAKAKPETLTQVGGSATATDSLTGKELQAQTGTKWKFQSFSGGADRTNALVKGDAQMMIGGAGDFVDLVKAGKLRIISVMGSERVSAFPDVPTLKEQGFDVTSLPEEFRGFVGPKGMSDEALKYYQDLLG